ncbi:alcohol dehydrogenase [Prevotella sp. oral taxon 376]|uniref:iron-containing alcohol dehydrogenase n=1 Tax=Prevotella sp. oral taxon 376 TaxID=712466 RepID=UPI000D1F5F42|nr:iron-containing alcohol dehydrogenase [Prevotella sp. oral taxon 376]PTL32844.1 alcohol dehydrogenase [Prevotella sp. oral taxon 376]
METKLSFVFPGQTMVLFGAGQLNSLHTLPMPGKKALLVISNGKSTRVNGYLDRTLNELREAGVEAVVFDKIQANPVKESVEEGAKVANENGCDFVVALGGGSVMDAAKVMAINATNSGDLWDYATGRTGKGKHAVNAPLPWIAITTTAGTGSEVDCAGVITNPETHEKLGLGDPRAFAVYAIVDPELMVSVPPRFTAYQGFDALFHSLEGYVSNRSNLYSDMVQEAAITNIGKYLPIACRDGKNMEARARVAFANTMSGYSMDTSACTAEHSIEHALSAYHEQLPHGAGLIMISRAYFTTVMNKHVCDDRFVNMAKMLGKADAEKPEDFITALVELQRACGVDGLKMSDYGITPAEFDTMASNALEVMGGLVACDRQPLRHDEIVEILKLSYK